MNRWICVSCLVTSSASNLYEVKFQLQLILYKLWFSLGFGTMEAMKNEFNEALLISRISKPPETAFRDILLPPSYFN